MNWWKCDYVKEKRGTEILWRYNIHAKSERWFWRKETIIENYRREEKRKTAAGDYG
jgi:hypothetical protein